MVAALEKIAERIDKFYLDIRAEVIAADLIDTGIGLDNIIVHNNGQQKRSFCNDLDEVTVESHRNKSNYLYFKLNRDGIYDGLPQSIFHEQKIQSIETNVAAMTKEYRQRKQEEKEARAFFTPLENEFFIQKCLIEIIERNIFFDINDNVIGYYGPQYLNISHELPEGLVSKITSLLPYVAKIAGNLPLTARCLSLMLDEEVSYKKYFNKENPDKISPPPVGKIVLGKDSTMGSTFVPDFPDFQFTIGPIKGDLLHFLEGGIYQNFLKNFYDFFIPFNMNVETVIKMTENKYPFKLSKDKAEARLGYSSVL